MSANGLEGEPSFPSETGGFGSSHVGLAGAVLDAVATWLAASRQSRVVKVPDFRGHHVSETFLPALQAGVKLHVVRHPEDPSQK